MVLASRPLFAYVILPAWPGPLSLLSRGGVYKCTPLDSRLDYIVQKSGWQLRSRHILYMVKTKDLYIFSLLSYRRVYTPTGVLLTSVTNEAPACLCMPLYSMYISSLKNKMEQAMTLWYQMETNKTYLLTATIAVPLTTATALQ